MAEAAEAELAKAGVTEQPESLLADAGYYNGPQIAASPSDGTEVLVPPDADRRKTPTKIRSGPHYEAMRRRLKEPRQRPPTAKQQMIEPVFAQIKLNQRAGRFSRRGLSACRAEWRLTAATHNLLKLYSAGLRLQTA